jgi:serine peptidase DegS
MTSKFSLFFLLVAGLFGLLAGLTLGRIEPLPTEQPRSVESEPTAPAGNRFDSAPSYALAVARAAESVVSIYTRNDAGNDDIGLGSGVIIDRQGHILTNHHNIKDAKSILVTLSNGTTMAGHWLGSDPDSDIAVLRIETDHSVPIQRPADYPIQVGDIVLAIGNPYGVGQTVTMGIVSALGRDQLGINRYENFIQTDAAINPGNSGGALINARGELIGINSAIYSKSGGSDGIGFAIPADMALDILNQLVSKGRVERGWIGITAQDLDNQDPSTGVRVSAVLTNAPADQAGIRTGDIIKKINGKNIANIHQLTNRIANIIPGATVPVAIMRDTEHKQLSLTVGARPRIPE